MMNSVSLLPPTLWSLSFCWFMLLLSVYSDSLAHMNVNLQVAELEQHIYRMMDVGRGITKDRHTIYRSHSCSSFLFMWGSLRLTPIIYYSIIPYSLNQTPLSISGHSRIVAAPLEVINEIVAMPRLLFEKHVST